MKVIISDNIMYKGYRATAGSKMLEDFTAPYNAAIVDKLIAAGAKITVKPAMEEFATAIISMCECDPKQGTCFSLRPSCGALNRWGLITYSSSFDQPILQAKTIVELKKLFDAIRNVPPPEKKSPRIANIKDLKIKNFEFVESAYTIIAAAETASNLARYDGVKYGSVIKDAKNIDELYIKTRTQYFGDETKRRINLGNYVLSSENFESHFCKAKKVQAALKRDMARIFEQYDMIIMPTGQQFSALASLIGAPTLKTPSAKFLAMGKPFGDDVLLANTDAIATTGGVK